MYLQFRQYRLRQLLCFIAAILLLVFVLAGTPPGAWRTVKNNEQVEYCVSLPLNNYKENFKKNDTRAKHVFTHKLNKKTEITVQGMLRSENNKTETYFNKYFEGAEEEGKIIEYKLLDKKNNRFYCGGYWSNSYYDTRFIEVVWLRGDELVKVESVFPVKDTTVWKAYLPRMIKQNINCN